MKQDRENNSWPSRCDVLVIARQSNRCTVLGPGIRAVIWVQGCPHTCKGCIAESILGFSGGQEVSVDSLAEELTALPDIEGVTFSGGEPFAQPAAFCSLIDKIRTRRDLGFMSYTGYRLAELHRLEDPNQMELLKRLDLLIDGRYIQGRHTDLIWRGSDNQQVHFLSDRYRHLAHMSDQRGMNVEVEFDQNGRVALNGILPPRFMTDFDEHLKELGVIWGPIDTGENHEWH